MSPQEGTLATTTLRARDCIPPDCPAHMFEVEILSTRGQPTPSRIGVDLQHLRAGLHRGCVPPCFVSCSLGDALGTGFTCMHGACMHGFWLADSVATYMIATPVECGYATPMWPSRALSAAIGLQYSENCLTKLPGFDRCSLAVHGDSGLHGCRTGPDSTLSGAAHHYMTFTQGDTIGVVVNQVDDSVSFVKNGICMGTALQGLPSKPLYPCIGFDGNDASVYVNFGTHPFKCVSNLIRREPPHCLAV
jgi:hypothetical protein